MIKWPWKRRTVKVERYRIGDIEQEFLMFEGGLSDREVSHLKEIWETPRVYVSVDPASPVSDYCVRVKYRLGDAGVEVVSVERLDS